MSREVRVLPSNMANLRSHKSSAIRNFGHNKCVPKAGESAPAISGVCREPKKVPNEGKIVFKPFCLSFAMQILILQLTGSHIRCSQGDKMYPVPSYEDTPSEVRDHLDVRTLGARTLIPGTEAHG